MSTPHCNPRLESTDCCRLSKNKPKPNTRFLKNIIKETDNHNAALRAKEIHDAKVRLRRLQEDNISVPTSGRQKEDQDGHRPQRSRLSDYDSHRSRKSLGKPFTGSKENDDRECGTYRRRHKCEHRRDTQHDKDEQPLYQRHSRHHHRHRRRSQESSRERYNRAARRRSSRDRDLSRTSGSGRDHSHNRKRHRKRHSSSPARSASPIFDKKLFATGTSYESPAKTRRKQPQTSPGKGSDSDPLESIIGPLPHPAATNVKARGRGTFSSAIDTHFSSHYDPAEDIQPNSDTEIGWDQALEALRDRQRWKQQGAERLRAAGFTAEEVGKWEKGGEKRQEDVRWSRKGEKREWDRGKVVGEDGVETKAEWTQTKGIYGGRQGGCRDSLDLKVGWQEPKGIFGWEE